LRHPTVTTQLGGNALPTTDEVFSPTTTGDRHVKEKASASIRGNFDSVSNEIDESDLQNKKHSEQRI
jgi:hypothetical protein